MKKIKPFCTEIINKIIQFKKLLRLLLSFSFIKDYMTIKSSRLFDAHYYLSTYSNLGVYWYFPVVHFIQTATIHINTSPERYGNWLREICQFTQNHFKSDEQLVFINAWNEWAEGCHLESDKKWGYAYLEATRNAMIKALEQNKTFMPLSMSYYFHEHLYLKRKNLLCNIFKIESLKADSAFLIDYSKVIQYLYVNNIGIFDYQNEIPLYMVCSSINEGFGYPPVEAMRYNKTSIVSDLTSFPEICGDAAMYCDPYDIQSIMQAILEVAGQKIPTEVIQ